MPTTKKPADVTLQDLAEWAGKQDPATVNPTTKEPGRSEPNCLYTDPTDPSKHCIVGQFFADHGTPPLLEHEGQNADKLAGRLGYSPEMQQVLLLMQESADRATRRSMQPGCEILPWANAIAITKRIAADAGALEA